MEKRRRNEKKIRRKEKKSYKASFSHTFHMGVNFFHSSNLGKEEEPPKCAFGKSQIKFDIQSVKAGIYGFGMALPY